MNRYEELIDDWIEHCHEGGGWSPHPISLRILSWGKLLLTPGALSLDPGQAQRLNASLGQQAQALSERLETRLQGNHLFSNILSCVFAGLMFEGKQADSWLALESSLLREFDLQILEDGSHVERSPMYHALLLENVLDPSAVIGFDYQLESVETKDGLFISGIVKDHSQYLENPL